MSDSDQRRQRHVTRDSETIRRWANDHDAVPVRESTESGSDQFRLVPEREMSGDQERAEWDTFFEEFESGDRVVVYRGATETDPFEMSSREDVVSRFDEEGAEERLLEGETVTSEITETTVVESVVTEELTVESELLDRTVRDQRVVDAELVDREATSCVFVENPDADRTVWFDTGRYLSQMQDRGIETETGIGTGTGDGGGETESETRTDAGSETRTEPVTGASTGTGSETEAEARTETGTGTGTETGRETDRSGIDTSDEQPYSFELDVDETWSVTREFVEEFVVQSRITGAEVTEADSIEDHEVDVEGLHRSIVESGLIGADRSPDEVAAAYDVESELAEDNRVQTRFTRDRIVEDEIVDRKRMQADVTGGEYLDVMTIGTRDVATEQEAGAEDREAVAVTDDIVGKRVVDAGGDRVGTVSAVDENSGRIYVDAHRGLGDRIMSALGMSDGDEDFALDGDSIERVTDDRVELKREEHLETDEH